AGGGPAACLPGVGYFWRLHAGAMGACRHHAGRRGGLCCSGAAVKEGEPLMVPHLMRVAVAFALLWAVPALAQAPGWVKDLQKGGYVIVLRHGATFADQADTNPLDPKDTAHQRQLNEDGRAAAKAMGEAMHKLKIPVGKVQTSQFQRAVDTGSLLGF